MPLNSTERPPVRRIDRLPRPLRGCLRPPGSKSLSTRALILAATAPDPLLVRDLLLAEDSEHLAEAIRAMGASVTRLFGNDWMVDGRGLRKDARPARVDLGDGGAPARFAMALAALRRGETIIDGSARLRERPIDHGVRLLRALGCRAEYAEVEGRLPVRVLGGGAQDCASELEVGATASSQFVSALMLIAPSLPRGLQLRFTAPPTSASYLALTVASLRAFGASVDGRIEAGGTIAISPGWSPPREVDVAPDASSAVVWVAAACMIPDSEIELPGMRRDAQPDVLAIEALSRMGAAIEWKDDGVFVRHAPLRGIDIDASDWPDGALAVAAAATAAEGTTRLRSLGTLRVKESDRLAALSLEFGRLGVAVRVEGDDLVIDGSNASAVNEVEVEVDAHRDHRIAMSLALVALRRGRVTLNDPGCVAKSYPGFWSDLERLDSAEARV